MKTLRALTLASIIAYCAVQSGTTLAYYVQDGAACWTTTTDGQSTTTCTVKGSPK